MDLAELLHGAGLHHWAYDVSGDDLEGGGEDDVSLKPFFCRMGSKFLLRKMIVPMIPPHQKYVEPFAGGAAIFFSKDKAVKSVLNDLDKETAGALKLLQHAPTALDQYPKSDTLAGHMRIFNTPPAGTAQKIARQVVKTCSGFSGTPVENSKRIYKSPSIQTKVKHIEDYKEKLKGVKITSQDYAKVIQQNDGPNTFFFIDPPYENTAKSAGYAEDKGFDFERLANVLSHIKGKFLMTMNASPRIRQLFSRFNQKPFTALSNLALKETSGKRKAYERQELFIYNYTLPSVRKSD